MSDDTNPTTDAAPGETTTGTAAGAPAGSRPAQDRPGDTAETGGDDGGAALERAQEAIDEAQDAQGTVAAHDDISSRDEAMAGEYSEDPDGAGGHP